MRKVYFTLLIVFITICNSYSQPLPKKIILKGSSELNASLFNNSSTVKTINFNLQPSIGRFINHYINTGIYLDYNYNKVQGGSDEKSVYTSFGPFVRFYIGDYNLIPIVHVNVGYTSSKVNEFDGEDYRNYNLSGVNYGTGVGVEYFIERRYSIEFLFLFNGYSLSNGVSMEDSYGGNKWINRSGLAFRIGTSIFLN